MRKVLIATPALDGRVHVHYADSLVKTVKLALTREIEILPAYVIYDALVQRARNDLVKVAIEQGFDDIFFIDADQQWDPQWVFTLLDYPVDAVGAPVCRKSDTESYNVRSNTLPIPVDPATGLLVVEGVGTGFLRLSREALKALWNSSTEYRDDERLGRLVFEVRVEDGLLLSEDHVLCEKLRALGFTVFVDANITCSHIGAKKWDGDFRTWLQRIYEDLPKQASA